MRKILFGVLIMMTTAFAVDYLVKVELDERRLEPFFEKGLMPIAELDNYALLLITDTDIDALTPHSYEIVATEPQRNEYYLVYVLSPTVDLSDFGRVLLIDGPVQLLELKPGMLEPLISENVDVSRVMFEPIVRSSPPAPLFYYNPLIQAIVDQVNPDTVLSFVQRLQDFKTRYSTHDSCHAAANYIAGKFTAYGCDSVYFQYHTTNHAPNVIGVKRGTVHPDSIYTVVCGHFDAISYMAPNVAPGADDNASGTTGVMEALRVMRDHQFEYSVRYIAFSGEEFGLYGSYYYASDARNRGDSILGVLNADMIGYVNAYPESLDVLAKISNPPCGAFADFFIAAADSYTTLLTNKQMVTSAAYSDHHPFWVNGYLALCNIEDNPPVNPFYHQPGDTIGAGYNDNTFCTEVIKAQVAALCLMAHPLAAAYLTTIDHWIIDSAPGGNGNGLWESGEEIDLIVRLQNLGIDTATNAYGLISSPSPYITIVEDSCYAGNIPAQDTAALAFRVSAAYAVPAPYEAHFDLYVACDTGAWDYSLMVYINPQPYLIFCDHAVVGGNGNGILEPGETADLVVTLANEGGAAAENVVSVLSTASSWVTVLDDAGAFGTI
ncbi:M28 family peptidase, partial [candidate division WOR-3 bacterium]|nr:M28 family peptidase [candidate division WOR-3 bacterium]